MLHDREVDANLKALAPILITRGLLAVGAGDGLVVLAKLVLKSLGV